jgi:hypothetical protein
VKTGEIYVRTIQYGENCMGQKKLYEWAERVKGGWTVQPMILHSGRSSIVTRVEVKEQNDQRIRDNRRVRIDKTSSEMSLMK